jgi:quercetin dioxygenase-like cupin family protein
MSAPEVWLQAGSLDRLFTYARGKTLSAWSRALIIRTMMMTRRDAVASLALFAELIAADRRLSAETQAAPAAPAAPRPPVFKHDLPNLTLDDWEVTVSHVDYPPGRVGTPHHHAGFVLAYVLEGAVISKISGQGDEKTYNVGQMFYEQPGATHEVSKNASPTQPAKLLAMIFAKKGSTLTNPGPAPGRGGEQV